MSSANNPSSDAQAASPHIPRQSISAFLGTIAICVHGTSPRFAYLQYLIDRRTRPHHVPAKPHFLHRTLPNYQVLWLLAHVHLRSLIPLGYLGILAASVTWVAATKSRRMPPSCDCESLALPPSSLHLLSSICCVRFLPHVKAAYDIRICYLNRRRVEYGYHQLAQEGRLVLHE